MHAFRLVYEFCVGKSEGADMSSVSESILGSELYLALCGFYDRHLPSLQASLLSSPECVGEYVRYWRRYYETALRVESIFHYLDRHWVVREVFDGKKLLPTVGMLWMKWNEMILRGPVEERLLAYIDGALRMERMIEGFDHAKNQAILDIVVSYKELSRIPAGSLLVGGDVAELKRHCIREDVFVSRYLPWYFQHLCDDSTALLDALEAKSVDSLGIASTVATFIKGERRRCQMYLGRDAAAKWENRMAETFHEAFHDRILRRLSSLVTELLGHEEDPREKLKTVFDLVNLFRGMRKEIADTVMQSFLDRLCNKLPHLMTMPLKNEQVLMLVTLLFAMFREGRRIVEYSMNNDQALRTAFDDSLHRYLNDRDASKHVYPILGEALARYLDRVIRDQEETSEDLIDFMRTVLRCLDHKSSFQKAHARLLARRLLARQLFQQDREELLLKPLEASYGPLFVSNYRRMLEDVNQSLQMTQKFVSGKRLSMLPFDLSLQVVTSGCWPAELMAEDENCKSMQWDTRLSSCLEAFSQSYLSEHSSRVLKWSPSLTAAEVSTVLGGRPYSLIMSAIQYAIIMAIAESGPQGMTLPSLCSVTGLSPSSIETAIHRLEHFNLLVTPSPTQYAINASFSSPHSRLNVTTRPNVDNLYTASPVSSSSEMNDDHSLRTQAALIRYLKQKQSCPRSDPAVLVAASGCESTLEAALKLLVEKEFIAIDAHTEVITYLP